MKIIFLDIDGVLNSEQFFKALYRDKNYAFKEFCPIACSNLIEILVEIPDVKIVVSSTWRIGRTIQELEDILFNNAGVPRGTVIGKTSEVRNRRGAQIEDWIKEETNPVAERFVILDDDSDMKPYMDRLVRTNGRHGLQLEDARRAVRLLGGEYKKEEFVFI